MSNESIDSISIDNALSVLEAAEPNLSPEQRKRLIALTSAGNDVRSGVTRTLTKPEIVTKLHKKGAPLLVLVGDSLPQKKRELSPEQATALITTLKSRYDSADKKLKKSIDFTDVEKSLLAAPEKLWSLQKLEETGGEPQVIGLEGDEFIFEDRSKESPSGRRNLNAHKVKQQAEEFGVDRLSPNAYKAMQKTGEYDLETASWLETPDELLDADAAVLGGRRDAKVRVEQGRAHYSSPRYGWRAVLRVKKA